MTFNFNPDGVYWTDGLKVRDRDPTDPAVSGEVNATSYAIPGQTTLLVPRTGAASPAGHSTPFVRHGLDWLPIAQAIERNAFSANVRNLSQVTFDSQRMGLKPTEEIEGTVTTDGLTSVVLTNVARRVKVTVDGTPMGTAQGTITVPLSQGTHTIILRP